MVLEDTSQWFPNLVQLRIFCKLILLFPNSQDSYDANDVLTVQYVSHHSSFSQFSTIT